MVMTHKERYLTAISHEEPDMVPVDFTFIDMVHVERITGKKAFATGGGGGGGGIALTEEELGMDLNEGMMRNQRLLNEAIRKVGADALIVSDYWLYPRGYRHRYIDQSTYVDQWGKIYRVRPDVKTTYWIGGTIKTEEDLDEYTPPEADELCYDIIDYTVEEAGEEYPVVGWCHGGSMFPYLVRGGIDKLALDIYTNPSFAKRLIKTIADVNFGISKKILDRGVDILAESDDIADTKGPFFPPRIFREFFFPHIERLIEECHRRGVPYMKHSDGNLYPILDDLVSMGIDGLHPIEPGAMDLAHVKRRYGERIFLRGNVDCMYVLPYGGEEDVRRDVRRCIDAAAGGGGFVLSDSNSIHSNVKTENIWVMVDEARRYGRYPLGR